MYGDDGLRSGRHGICDFGLVQVEGIGPYIDEDRPGAPQDKGVHGGYEGEIGDNHLVARLHTKQDRTHVQRMCA